MLIKIQTAQHADSFLLIDRVGSVRYAGNPTEFRRTEVSLTHLRLMADIESTKIVLDPASAGMGFPYLPTPHATPEDYLGKLGDTRGYRVSTPTYEREGQMRSVTFDPIAYICTDEGKTLERARAGGALND